MEFDATFLVAVISFTVFVKVMEAIFYTPILRIMRERNQIVEDNFNKAKNIADEVQNKENYHNNELELKREESRKTLDKEITRLNGEKQDIISKYRVDVLTNVMKERDNLKKTALEAQELLKESVIDISKNISNILLGEIVNHETINKSNIQIKEEQV